MDDMRWPWLVLVPRSPGAKEWHDLSQDQWTGVNAEVKRAAHALRLFTQCEKVNIASLGNVVGQLHIHVVARNPGDPNWPGPVWGFERADPYGEDLDRVLGHYRSMLGEENTP